MDFPTKIKMAEAVAKVKEAELARRMDTTPAGIQPANENRKVQSMKNWSRWRRPWAQNLL